MGKKSQVEGPAFPPRARTYQEESQFEREVTPVSILTTAPVLVSRTADAVPSNAEQALSDDVTDIFSRLWRSQFRLYNYKNKGHAIQNDVTKLEARLRVVVASKTAKSIFLAASSSKPVDARLAHRPPKRKLEEEDEEIQIRSQLEQNSAEQMSIAAKYSAEVKIYLECFANLYNAQMAEVNTLVHTAITSQPQQEPQPSWKAELKAEIQASVEGIRENCFEAFETMVKDRTESNEGIESKLESSRQETMSEFDALNKRLDLLEMENTFLRRALTSHTRVEEQKKS